MEKKQQLFYFYFIFLLKYMGILYVGRYVDDMSPYTVRTVQYSVFSTRYSYSEHFYYYLLR